MVTRGFRNNNPGNIIKSDIKWKGEKNKGKDIKFEEFETIEYGVRAMIMLIKHYIIKDGRNTIEKIVKAYAPSNENDTDNYIETVESITLINRNKVLSFDKDTMHKLIEAMVYEENGVALPSGVFDKAWNMI